MIEGYGECEAIVRRDDPDRAVAIMFAPAEKRSHLAALYAFDLETARIRRIVSQPLPGEIRLQWWRDRIEAHAADPFEADGQGNPVAAALLDTITRFALPAGAFERLLEARVFDLYDDPMPTRSELESYAGESACAVMMLAAMILDREAAPLASDVAGHAGVAAVVALALQRFARRPDQAQVFLPSDILEAVACPREALQDGADPRRLRALDAFAAFGREHLARAKSGLSALPRSLRPAFLAAEGMETHLRADVPTRLRPARQAAPMKRLFAYWRAMRR